MTTKLLTLVILLSAATSMAAATNTRPAPAAAPAMKPAVGPAAAPAAPPPAPAPAPAATEEVKAAPADAPATSATVTESEATVNEVDTIEAGSAQSAGSGVGVEAKLGAMLPTSGLNLTYFVALEASYRLPFWQRLLGLGLEVSLSGPGDSGTVRAANVGGSFDYELSTRIIGLGFEAFATRSFGPWSPYGGVGYGLYFLHLSETALGSTNTEDQIRAGLGLRGGCGYRLGPGDLVAELRYHYVNLRFSTTGKSNAGGVTLAVGYRYAF
jgi:hypothetical protein